MTFLELQSALRCLQLRGVKLTDGSWAYAFDRLRALSQFTDVLLGDRLIDSDGTDVFDITYENHYRTTIWTVKLQDAITEYVIHGGTNPLRLQSSPNAKLPWINDTDQNRSLWQYGGHRIAHPR